MKLAFLFSVTAILCAQLATAFEFPSDQKIKQIAESKQWRALLHFSKGYFSDRSKVQGAKFFLSAEGSRNPASELKVTLDKMTSADVQIKKTAQCQYPARREFLFKSFPEFIGEKVECPEMDAWLEKLSADKISLIFASGYLNSAPSSFGHTFLKLQSQKNQGKELLNYGINFSARTDEQDGILYAWKGLLGFFPANFSLMQYHLMIKEYVNLEGRDLWEYQLNLIRDEIRMLLYHILELELGYFDYYFMDENCSSMILNILQIVRPELELISDGEIFVIPIDTLKPLSSMVVNTIYRPSLKTIFGFQWQQLNSSQKSQIKDYLAGDTSELDVQTLETLQSWVSIKEAKDTLGYRDLSYSLAVTRAKITETPDPVQVPIPTAKPMDAHSSSQVGIGIYQAPRKTMLEFQWMPVFHDRLARSQGLPPFSEIKILNFEFLIDKEIELKNFDLIQVLSNSPVHVLEAPISWGFSVGDSHYQLAEQNQHQRAFGHIGFSLASNDFCILLAAKAGMQQVLEPKLQALGGPSLVGWVHLTRNFRAGLESDWLLFKDDYLMRQQYSFAFDLTSDYWLKLDWQSRSAKGFHQEDAILSLNLFF